jgi:UTP--glucose-1-phosphate uridylyltransferase
VPRAQTKRYGILDVGGEDGPLVRAKGVVEKPAPDQAPSTLAIIGRYILEPEVFEHLGRIGRGAGDEIQLTDALARMIGGKTAFHGFRFDGRRFDCGDKVGFLEATIAYALARPNLAGEMRRILQDYRADAAEPAGEAPPNHRRQRH